MTDKSLTQRWLEHMYAPRDDLRARIIEGISKHMGWEESAIAITDEVIMPAIRKHLAGVQNSGSGHANIALCGNAARKVWEKANQKENLTDTFREIAKAVLDAARDELLRRAG